MEINSSANLDYEGIIPNNQEDDMSSNSSGDLSNAHYNSIDGEKYIIQDEPEKYGKGGKIIDEMESSGYINLRPRFDTRKLRKILKSKLVNYT